MLDMNDKKLDLDQLEDVIGGVNLFDSKRGSRLYSSSEENTGKTAGGSLRGLEAARRGDLQNIMQG